MMNRSNSINIPVREMVERGTLQVQQFRPWSFDAGLFVDQVRKDIQSGAQIVMIDSISSYEACGDSARLRAQLLRVCKHLIEQGITVLLVNELRDITGTFRATEGEISHLADNLVFLRYLEIEGELRKAIGVLKKRAGNFEKSLREFRISKHGISRRRAVSWPPWRAHWQSRMDQWSRWQQAEWGALSDGVDGDCPFSTVRPLPNASSEAFRCTNDRPIRTRTEGPVNASFERTASRTRPRPRRPSPEGPDRPMNESRRNRGLGAERVSRRICIGATGPAVGFSVNLRRARQTPSPRRPRPRPQRPPPFGRLFSDRPNGE